MRRRLGRNPPVEADRDETTEPPAVPVVAAPTPEPEPAPPPAVTLDERAVVEQFLYREARLLDERRLDDWLALWAEDGTYAVPTRSIPQHDPQRSVWSVEDELTPADGIWWVDEDRDTMAFRIAKMQTGKAWAEDPPSLTRRFVSNIEVRPDGEGRYRARSNVLLYRHRRHTDLEVFTAARRDQLGTVDGRLVIRSRHVTLDVTVLAAANLVLFF